jgi:4-amino-4-deoxy-L-arabinose transferase-like glycosyltransferase
VSRRHVLLLAGGALAVRLLYNLAFLRSYTSRSDADHYVQIAGNVADGDGIAASFPFLDAVPQATAFRPPLFPLLLGGLYGLLGEHLEVARALNILLGVGVVVLTALLGTRLAGLRVGLVAGALAAVYPPLLANDGPPLSEPLGLCLLLGTCLLLADERLLAAGATSGLLVLTRPGAHAVAAVLGLWLLWTVGWRGAVRFAVPVVLLVTPWVVRNWVVLDSPTLVTSNGLNLAALYAEEPQARDRWVDPVTSDEFREVRRRISQEGEDEVALDRAFRDAALDGLRERPLAPVEVTLDSLRNLLELKPVENEPAERADGRNLTFRYVTLPAFWLVTAAGLAGLWTLRRQRAAAPLLLAAVVFTLVSLPATAMPPRLRAPLDVACCIGAATAVSWYVEARRRAFSPPVGPVAAGPAGSTGRCT